MSKSIVYIVSQDLGGLVYTAGFTSLLEAKCCRAQWCKKWGGHGVITIMEQWIYDVYEDVNERV